MSNPVAATTRSLSDRLADLAAQALLGTERADGAGGSRAALILLREAAILGTRRRAGLRPRVASRPMPECPDDPLPPVNTACAASLRLFLADPQNELVEEWAELAAARGKRVPDGLAAPLLDWWARRTGESESVPRVLGVRLEWLCALNPTWHKRATGVTIPSDVESAWQSGAVAERLTLLKVVRRIEPARAEPLLRESWSQDGADERKRFLEAFEINLASADEAFLESVLNDRSKQARAVASMLLARLPGSRLVGRMLDRAARMVRIEPMRKGILKRVSETIVVEPPQDWDAAWERDGLDEKPPAGIGKRAWWLSQVLSAAPPETLAQRLGLSRDRLIVALAKGDYAKQAIPAICTAAAAARDETWCADLARHLLNDKATTAQSLEPLWRALPQVPREALLLDIIQKGHLDWSQRCVILAAADHRWSADFSARICQTLSGERPSKPPEVWAVASSLDRVSRWIHPGALSAYEKLIADLFRDQPPPSAIKGIDRLRLRADMHKEFAQ